MFEPLLFMFFSTIETFSLYFLIMSLFRFKWQQHAWPALTVILGINVQSYVLRNELNMSSFVPLISILAMILFFSAVVKMPLVLSVVATISGFVIYVLVQATVLYVVFGSIESVNNDTQSGYMLQLTTSILVITAFRLLYIKGKGFTFDLERLRLKIEDILLTILVTAFLLGVSFLLFYQEIYLIITVTAGMSYFLLHYSKRKELLND